MGEGYARVVEDIDPEVWKKLPSWARELIKTHRRVRDDATGCDDVEAMLEAELEKLKKFFRTGYELEVSYIPDLNSKLAGEVKGDRIFIYEGDVDEALTTLKHEFVDYIVSKPLSYYRDITNMFIKLSNERAYREKERLVEALVKLLSYSYL